MNTNEENTNENQDEIKKTMQNMKEKDTEHVF
jgi:hypothetical protein